MSKTHKNQTPLLNLLINCVSAQSAPQILSLKDEYTFFGFLAILQALLHNVLLIAAFLCRSLKSQ